MQTYIKSIIYLLSSMFYVLCSMFYVLCSMFYVLCSMFYVLQSIFYILYSIFYILCSIFYIYLLYSLYLFYILSIYYLSTLYVLSPFLPLQKFTPDKYSELTYSLNLLRNLNDNIPVSQRRPELTADAGTPSAAKRRIPRTVSFQRRITRYWAFFPVRSASSILNWLRYESSKRREEKRREKKQTGEGILIRTEKG